MATSDPRAPPMTSAPTNTPAPQGQAAVRVHPAAAPPAQVRPPAAAVPRVHLPAHRRARAVHRLVPAQAVR